MKTRFVAAVLITFLSAVGLRADGLICEEKLVARIGVWHPDTNTLDYEEHWEWVCGYQYDVPTYDGGGGSGTAGGTLSFSYPAVWIESLRLGDPHRPFVMVGFDGDTNTIASSSNGQMNDWVNVWTEDRNALSLTPVPDLPLGGGEYRVQACSETACVYQTVSIARSLVRSMTSDRFSSYFWAQDENQSLYSVSFDRQMSAEYVFSEFGHFTSNNNSVVELRSVALSMSWDPDAHQYVADRYSITSALEVSGGIWSGFLPLSPNYSSGLILNQIRQGWDGQLFGPSIILDAEALDVRSMDSGVEPQVGTWEFYEDITLSIP